MPKKAEPRIKLSIGFSDAKLLLDRLKASLDDPRSPALKADQAAMRRLCARLERQVRASDESLPLVSRLRM